MSRNIIVLGPYQCTGCFKESFSTLKAYMEDMCSVFNCHNVAKHTEFYLGIVTVQCDFHCLFRVFQKERYNGIPNVTVWRVLRKRLHSKACKRSIVEHFEWIVCTPLSAPTMQNRTFLTIAHVSMAGFVLRVSETFPFAFIRDSCEGCLVCT
jgi:hypothetical protein